VFALGRTKLERGDLLFVYTDGVTEARDVAGRFFTEDRMLAVVLPQPVGADELLDLIEQAVSGHVGAADQFDDITMIALHRQPA